jgi:hypothetical protein
MSIIYRYSGELLDNSKQTNDALTQDFLRPDNLVPRQSILDFYAVINEDLIREKCA